ncbi:DUF2254 domain-containing protein [Caldimonas tepidiphila]|uniref:DUF2254 domain-containing protein n=1 Tax=Caldimonas tepidiphila TaxID=2315841 RepID=UPI000E5B7C9C|nr:DUF2254 domain-containing protein [Caldimonas tepidiphila]
MNNRAFVWWEKLRTGLWVVPLAMLPLTILLHQGAGWIDRVAPDQAALRTWWLYSGSGDDARNLLSTLVAAIITMSSVVFSITVVTLSLAANQFGSRMVRIYMSDLRTKVALGLFTMTIVYCLLGLRAVQKDMPAAEVPHVTVTLGLLLGLTCVLALLLFLHVVARSIVADEVARRVAGELEDSIAQLRPLEPGRRREDAEDARLPHDFEARSVILASRDEGYVQAVDYEALAALAARHGVLLRLDFKPGEFMCRHGWLGAVHPGEAVDRAFGDAVQDRILIGRQRTPTQDLEFSIRHLIDIALRALSPGINDANTALMVIDRLRGALSRLMGKELAPCVYRDAAGEVRLVCRRSSHADILDAALHQIRQAAARQPAIVIRLLEALARIAEHVRLPEQRESLRHHARLIAAAGLREAQEPGDRTDIEEAFAGAERKLEQALRRRLRTVGRTGPEARAVQE